MTIAYVNGGSNAAAANANDIAAPAIDAAAGNTLIVCISIYQPDAAISQVTDTAGNTFNLCGNIEGGDANHKMGIYVATNIIGNASNIVTAAFSAGASWRNILVLQYSGLAASSVYDVAAAVKLDASATATHTTNPTETTNQADELIIGFYASWDSPQIPGASDPYTIRQYTAGYDCVVADRIVSSTGQYSITISSGNTNQLVSQVRTFKASAAAAASLINHLLTRNRMMHMTIR